MSNSPVDKKRRWLESVDGSAISTDASTISRPPLKKRFTANGKISNSTPSQSISSNNEQFNPQSSSSSSTPVSPHSKDEHFIIGHDQLPKDALLKRMRSAKEEFSSLENRIANIDLRCEDFEVQRSVIRIQWNMLQSDILVFSRALVDGNSDPMQGIPKDEQDTGRLEQELHRSQATIREAGLRILKFIRAWVKRTDHIGVQDDQKQELVQWVRNETEELRASYERNRALSKEMESQYHSLLEQSDDVLNSIRTKENQLCQAQEALYQCSEKLAQAEKRYDRAESTAVASLLSSGLAGPQSAQRDGSPATHAPSATTQVQEPVKNETKTLENEACKTEVAEQQLIVDARVKEIEDLQRERQTLVEDTERLRNEFAMLTDEKLLASEYYKALQLSLEHYKSRAHYLHEIQSQLDHELEEVKAERRKLVEEINSEKLSQSMAMETEMRRLESDLARIRKQRDDFQGIVDTYTSKKAREKQLHGEVSMTIENEANRITKLEQQTSSLRAAIRSCEEGGDNPLNHTVMAFDKIYSRIINAKTIVKHLELKYHTNSADGKEMTSSDTEELRQKLAFWIDGDIAQMTDVYRSIKELMEKVDEQSLKSKKLQLMMEFLSNSETQLMTQIDRAGSIFTQLEEQSGKPVFDLSRRNEQREKLRAEKVKFGHTFPGLKASKDKHMLNVAGLRRTSEQQLEHIRQLEDRERTLELQINEKESEVRSSLQSLEERRVDVEDLQHKCGELRIKLEHSDHFLGELQKMVKDKTRTLEEERQLRKKVDDDYSKMSRQWAMVSQGENPAEGKLAEECNDFRMLLKCGACHDRVRNKLLAKCMHTFCAQCIDKRLETRQRRCPTCGDSFGVSDVRNFYL
ncbi:hypothetical protein BDB00DRAFT_943256 [Zychaea mexicana]|uniref:uncharacterized protein n=1 Tax=Zychaea mexicana TaxID=64656 RepID=UPI0022FE7F73|nr:uncharacterized protein BDB00DRAFT_943256 [Zychaea mexicana]KAI9482578.1 hypothetical protein BDB00DRAFT_943256 [Zychaea mexicana]